MKRLILSSFILISFYLSVTAQVNDVLLAQQFTANGEQQKALDIYQKLYKQNNENYFSLYINALLNLKKFDEAEAASKKMARKHPDDYTYAVTLGRVYTQQGNMQKANAIYDDLIKNLPANAGEISNMANQFYQAANIDYAVKAFEQGRKVLHNDKIFSFDLINLYRYKRDKVALTNEYLNFLKENPVYLAQAENAMASVLDGEADYSQFRSALLKRIQKDPDVSIYTSLLVWQYLQQKDFDQALNQSLALSRRQNDGGSSIFELCQTLVANEAYDDAIRGYEFIISQGKTQQYYVPAKIDLINTKSLKVTAGRYTPSDLLNLENDYVDLLNEFGRNSNTAFAMQKLAKLEALKLHKLNEAQKLLESIIAMPNLRPDLLANCKLDLGDVYLMNSQPWDATLIYSQVDKANSNTPIGQDAQFRNAKLAYYTGDFHYAKGQLDILKAATSQLIANDALNLSLLISDNLAADSAGNALKIYARADLLIFKEEPEKAMATLDSINSKYPNNALTDDILMAKARIFIQQKNYSAAVSPLKKIVQEHPFNLWADDAVFMLGDLFDNFLGDKTQAKSYYQKIITNYAGSLWITEARKRFRLLRGDRQDGTS